MAVISLLPKRITTLPARIIGWPYTVLGHQQAQCCLNMFIQTWLFTTPFCSTGDFIQNSWWDSTRCVDLSRIHPLLPSNAMWNRGTRSTSVQVMACCLAAPSHCLNQCWLTTKMPSSIHSRVMFTCIFKTSVPKLCSKLHIWNHDHIFEVQWVKASNPDPSQKPVMTLDIKFTKLFLLRFLVHNLISN